MVKLINTDQWSSRWRHTGIDLDNKKILLTNFHGTEQEADLSESPNCEGFGRIRHFRRETSPGWPLNPLPIDPALKFLGGPSVDLLRAQVFQNAVCNWRCWYCFVPFNLLSANHKHSAWLTAEELLDLHLSQPEPPRVLDLTGGQPDLTPEWVPWMIQEVRLRGMEKQIYIWSDDNLSTDYFWTFLSASEIDMVADAKNYGRVCCFKGFDEMSFSFNTLAERSLYLRQFELFRRFVNLGIDVYAYVTLTSSTADRLIDRMKAFVDKLQGIHENLPLRTVPLEIQVFSPVHARVTDEHRKALEIQQEAIVAWNTEIEDRYSQDKRTLPITEVSLTQ
jgi:organic radical activating enzyme